MSLLIKYEEDNITIVAISLGQVTDVGSVSNMGGTTLRGHIFLEK